MSSEFKKFLIFSATSEIANQTIKKLAKDGTEFYLTGRNEDDLKNIKGDLEARGAKVVATQKLDVLDLEQSKQTVKDAFNKLGEVDCVLVAQGMLPAQADIEENTDYAVEVWNVNTTSVIAISIEVCRMFREQGYGSLAVISSVAADRGRKVNYLYGGSEAAVSTFLEGLRMRMHSEGVNIIDIKPGPVNTRMTKNMGKMPLLAKPDKVASDIVSGILKGKKVVYTPSYWSVIMKIIQFIPEAVYRRLPI